jgi:hypothetical protein
MIGGKVINQSDAVFVRLANGRTPRFPVHHGSTAARVATYRVEPYVLTADVYSRGFHAGRGGWTWYTGSAGWMYRVLIENPARIQPCWESTASNTPSLPFSMSPLQFSQNRARGVFATSARHSEPVRALRLVGLHPIAQRQRKG